MKQYNILFVCLGNICRSPAAEGIMKHLASVNHTSVKLNIHSAGLIDYHVGEPPDERMIVNAAGRGYNLDSIARKFDPETDFKKFDLIIAMDNDVYKSIKNLDRQNRYSEKIKKMTDFSEKYDVDEVPDPYYGSSDNFNYVLDILEDACSGLMKKLDKDG